MANSLKGMVVGLVLFVAGFPVLWLNEGYAVRTARSLTEGAGEVVSVAPDRVDPANDGKLVHVAGLATTADTVSDPLFNVSANAIRLRRKVEMYQWRESTNTRNDTKTYKYSLAWSEQPVDSSSFRHPEGHQNPSMPLRSADFAAAHVTVGAFRLNAGQVARLTGDHPVDTSSATIPDAIRARARPDGSGFYAGDPASPQAGDLRIAFTQVRPAQASIVARQTSGTFEPYRARAGGEVDLVEMGIQSPAAMFDAAQTRNTIRTWILRGVGLLVMFFGLALLLKPISTLGEAVPLIGGILGAGVAALSFAVALCLSLATIATAWIAYRPLVGAALLAGAFLAVIAALRLGRRGRVRSRAAGAA